MSDQNETPDRVCSSAMLDLCPTSGKSGDFTVLAEFSAMNDANLDLNEMHEDIDVFATVVESLKRKGVRFVESDFPDGDVVHKNKYVTIIRGKAAEFLYRETQRLEKGLS